METLNVVAGDIEPNDTFTIAGVSVRVRYIHYYHSKIESIKGQVTLDLQRFEDRLHPLCDKTFMRITLNIDEKVEVNRGV